MFARKTLNFETCLLGALLFVRRAAKFPLEPFKFEHYQCHRSAV